jgi:hypothetical protein
MKKFASYVGLLIVLLVAIYFIPHGDVPRNQDAYLPAKLQVSGVLAEGVDTSPMDYFGMRREFCGAIVFTLAPATIAAIKKEGLSFFADVTQSRDRPDWYGPYKPWKATPTPANWFGDGIIAGSLGCATIDRTLWRRIQDGSLRAGGFYAVKNEAQLIVLPDEGLAIFTYYG